VARDSRFPPGIPQPRRLFSPTKPQRPVIAGRLHHHETGYPLAGVSVRVDLTNPPERPRAIGSAVSDVGEGAIHY
jgi:hypothetical protein